MARLAASLLFLSALVAPISGCAGVAAALLPSVISAVKEFAITTRRQAADAIRVETARAAEDNKLNPLEVAMYAAFASLVGGGSASYVGAKNGKKRNGS